MRQKAAGNQGALLKEQGTKISPTGTHPGLQQGDGGLEDVKVIQGETKLCGFGERAGGTAANAIMLSPSDATHRCHLSLVEHSPHKALA